MEVKAIGRRVLLVIGFVIFTTAVIMLTIGATQDYAARHALDDCKKIDTGTRYKGYDCGYTKVYEIK